MYSLCIYLEFCDKLEMEKEKLNGLNCKLKAELELQKHELVKTMKEYEKKAEHELEQVKLESENARISFQNKGTLFISYIFLNVHITFKYMP